MSADFKKRLWIRVGVIAGSIAIAIGAFWYFSGVITTQAAKVAMLKQEAANNASAEAQFAALESAAPKAARYAAAFQSLLPDQSSLINFNAWLVAAGQRYGVQVAGAFRGTPVPPAGNTPGTASFTITAQGPEGSLVPFLDYLTQNDPGFIVSFKSFDYTNDRTQENLTAQGVTYFQ
jgi:hypothetical protein